VFPETFALPNRGRVGSLRHSGACLRRALPSRCPLAFADRACRLELTLARVVDALAEDSGHLLGRMGSLDCQEPLLELLLGDGVALWQARFMLRSGLRTQWSLTFSTPTRW
jgi:hypothetical protein